MRLESSNSFGPRRGLGSTQLDASSDTVFLVRRNSRRHVVPRTMRCGTVGEPDTTVPASPQALIAAGIADVNAPPTIIDALEEDLKMNTGETEVVRSGDDVSEPMPTRPATHNELREAGVVMPLFSPPPLEVVEPLERDLVPTQWESGAEFSLVRNSGFTHGRR